MVSCQGGCGVGMAASESEVNSFFMLLGAGGKSTFLSKEIPIIYIVMNGVLFISFD